ncbi:hypothetical protein [Zunongwangia sp. H14]|uniref:hypothetical protein n=1 Tax=Zunongwangia sp. H14 TaxID=3240792 RepID=UPI003568DA24
MKKLILVFTLLFTISSSLISCKNNESKTEEMLENDYDNDIIEDDEEAGVFDEYDKNGDGYWTKDEFGDSFENDFADWDGDDDGTLDEDEFYKTTFGNTDANDDDSISEEEWNQGYSGMYGNYAEEADFDTFDANDDGILDMNEWRNGFSDSEWFDPYDGDDSDDLITEAEWNDGLYGDWDTNSDGRIDEDEFVAYNGYYENW